MWEIGSDARMPRCARGSWPRRGTRNAWGGGTAAERCRDASRPAARPARRARTSRALRRGDQHLARLARGDRLERVEGDALGGVGGGEAGLERLPAPARGEHAPHELRVTLVLAATVGGLLALQTPG